MYNETRNTMYLTITGQFRWQQTCMLSQKFSPRYITKEYDIYQECKFAKGRV